VVAVLRLASAARCRNHEDAIYPTTKLSKITTASWGGPLAGLSKQCLLGRNQKRHFASNRTALFRTAQSNDLASFLIRTQLELSQLQRAGLPARLIFGEAAESRARPAGCQLGEIFSRVASDFPRLAVLLSFSVFPSASFVSNLCFSDFPTSEIKYTDLQFLGKGPEGFLEVTS
jgi:hypothetical protein